MNLIEQARAACNRLGIEYKDVPADGRWHSADIENDPRGKGDGRIKLFLDGRGGIVHNHKTGANECFFINSERVLTVTEKKTSKKLGKRMPRQWKPGMTGRQSGLQLF